jgi:predicted enzyme related to lactoylglutathione lyase
VVLAKVAVSLHMQTAIPGPVRVMHFINWRTTMVKETNKIDFIEFPAQDIEEIASTKRFYSGVFGWSFKDWGDDYIDTTSSGLSSGFNADPQHRPTKPLVVVYSHDLEITRSKILAAGGKVTKEIFSFPGGRRFHFTGLAFNELAVWSDQ